MMLPTGKNKLQPEATRLPTNSQSYLRGFTLVELLLSVVILAFGLVTIIGSYISANSALTSSQNHLAAVEFLKDRLTNLRRALIEQNVTEPGDSSEEALLNNRPANYSLEISPLGPSDDLDLSPKLNTAKLTLSWKERNTAKDVSLVTYLEKKP